MTPVEPIVQDLPTAGPFSLAGLPAPRMAHWFRGLPDSRLLVLRDRGGEVVGTWRMPEDAEIRHLSEALSADGRYLAWTSGKRPDGHLAESLDPPMTLHIQDLAEGREVLQEALFRPEIRDELRRQVLTVDGHDASRKESWEDPDASEGGWWDTSVIVGAFNNGIGRVAWSPDGTTLAVVAALDGPTSDVYLVDRADFALRRLTDEPEHVRQFDWSPDGRTLVYVGAWEPQSFSNIGGSHGVRATYLMDVAADASWRYPPAESSPRPPQGPMNNMENSEMKGNTADGWPMGWTLGGEPYMLGCGMCGLDRLGAHGEGVTTMFDVAHDIQFTGMPAGDWVAVMRRDYKDGHDCSIQFVDPSRSGTFLLHVPDGEVARVDEEPRDVAYWGLDEYPFVMVNRASPRCGSGTVWDDFGTATPLPPVAFGPDDRRMELPALQERSIDVIVSPDRQWRLACTYERCQVFGEGPEAVGGWNNPQNGIFSVDATMFSPDSRQVAFEIDEQLYLVDLPAGQPRRLSAFEGRGFDSREACCHNTLSDTLGWFAAER